MDLALGAALRDLQSRHSTAREQAARLLGTASPCDDAERVVTALRAALADPAEQVRYRAALALGELGSAAGPALGELIAMLEHDDSSLVRQGCAVALGDLGSHEAVEPLLRALRQDCADVRFQIPAALCALGDVERAGPALLRHVDDPDREVRLAVIAALGDLRYAPAGERLRTHLQDADDDVRFEVTLAAARLGDREATVQLGRFLRHSEHRWTAARQLLDSPQPELRPILRREARRWLSSPLIKVYLAGALARLGDSEGQSLLQKLAESRRQPVRGLAREVIESMQRGIDRDADRDAGDAG